MLRRNKDSKKEKTNSEKSDKPKLIDLSKWHVKTIIIVLSVIIIAVLFLLFLKVNFLVDDKLRMSITPEYLEKNTISPGILELEVETKIYNKFLCTAKCSFELMDISSDDILDYGNFTAKSFKNEKYSKEIILDSKGYGTNLYLYRIECVNTYTTLCPAIDDRLVRKSLFVVSYSPDDAQLSALEYSKNNYNLSSYNYIQASKILSGTGEIISTLNIPVSTKEYYSISSDLDLLDNDFNEIIEVWNTQDMIKTKSLIDSKNILERSSSLLDRSKTYNDEVIGFAKTHNVLVDALTNMRRNIIVYDNLNFVDTKLSDLNLSSVKLQESTTQYNSIANDISNTYNYTLINSSYYSLKSKLFISNNNSAFIISSFLKDMYPALYVQSEYLCKKNNKCLNETFDDFNYISENMNQNITQNNINTLNSDNLDILITSYEKLIALCDISNYLISNIVLDNNSNTTMDSLDSLLFQYDILMQYYSDTENSDTLKYIEIISNKLENYYNISNPDDYLSNNSLSNISSIYFENSNTLYSKINFVKTQCQDIDLNRKYDFESSNILIVKSQTYNISIIDDSNIYDVDVSVQNYPELVPQCCAYGKCQSCDKYIDSEKHPLIMLHGHSFVQDSSAYSSVEIFNSFEKKFTQENIYLPTGILTESDSSTPRILGGYNIAVMSKPTYYLQSYNDLLGLKITESKTGNIDTYALRLKEQIDYTKYVTGAEKVDIVAHSMGGLVTRRYIQIFGSEDIDTIILIGTPNQGITDRIYTFCKIFGETNECDDMKSGGLFLKKLNGEQNNIDFKKLYLVIGRGCDTDGQDGDGVVVSNNSLIKDVSKDHILYVEGKCSGARVLHNDMLDEKLYPEVYWFVKEKLSKN